MGVEFIETPRKDIFHLSFAIRHFPLVAHAKRGAAEALSRKERITLNHYYFHFLRVSVPFAPLRFVEDR